MVQQSDLIRQAVATGYSADSHNGVIFNRIGQPMSIQHRGDRNPTFRVRISKQKHEISVSKFIAYIAWGEIALTPDTQVMHLNGDLSDNRLANLQIRPFDQRMQERQLRSAPPVQSAAAELLATLQSALAQIPEPVRDAAVWRLSELISGSHIPLAEAVKAADLGQIASQEVVTAQNLTDDKRAE